MPRLVPLHGSPPLNPSWPRYHNSVNVSTGRNTRVRTRPRRGRWRPGGWQNGRRGRSGRSVLQPAASPSIGKRASRFCDTCDPASCGHGLASCGSDGAGCKAGCPAGSILCILSLSNPCPHHPGSRRQVLKQHISTGGATALPLTQVESQGVTFAVADPMKLVGHAPLDATNQARGTPPLLNLAAVGWALMSVASIISTSGSGASDADNSEKIRSKHPCLTSNSNGCRGFCGDQRPPGHPPSATPPGYRR